MARSICWYGPTGTWKTTQAKFLARYVAETTGKATLLLSADDGGWEPCRPEIDAGMIRPYLVERATIPLPILRRISQGYWPKDPAETNPERINLVPMNFDEVGGIMVEGWTSIGYIPMRFLPNAGISVGGEDRSKSNMSFKQPVIVNGAAEMVMFGSNTRGDYNWTMNFLADLVSNFNALPVRIVGYSALEAKTEDDDRSTVFGPAIPGKKAIAICGTWVGDLLHAQDLPIKRVVKVPDPANPGATMDTELVDMRVRYYFRRHLDAGTGIPFPAKTRVAPEKQGELNRLLPGGYFEPTPDWGVDRYLHTVDKIVAAGAGDNDPLRKWREAQDAKLGRGKPLTPKQEHAVATTTK